MKWPRKPLKSGFSSVRDVLVFGLGALIIVSQVRSGSPDPGVLLAGGSLLGLPAFLPRGDGK